MNAVEIEVAKPKLADSHFKPEEFPFLFLDAFGTRKPR